MPQARSNLCACVWRCVVVFSHPKFSRVTIVEFVRSRCDDVFQQLISSNVDADICVLKVMRCPVVVGKVWIVNERTKTRLDRNTGNTSTEMLKIVKNRFATTIVKRHELRNRTRINQNPSTRWVVWCRRISKKTSNCLHQSTLDEDFTNYDTCSAAIVSLGQDDGWCS